MPIMGTVETVTSILFLALVVGLLFQYLKIPSILGYLLVGAATGPHALGLIPDEQSIREVAECGIVLLMFTIGLQFSLSKLIALRHKVFVVGSLQVLITIAVTSFIGISFNMNLISALTVGGIVAMSSTAIVMQLFTELGDIDSVVGQNAVGILLAQDLAVIPILILLSQLSDHSGIHISRIILAVIMNSLAAFLLILITSRWVIRPLFKMVSATRSVELFTMLVLLVVLVTAELTHWLKLSYALGTFLAGVMLSETEFKHRIDIEVRPFRDILLGLFFITIGTLIDMTIWHNTWQWILLVVVALVLGKTVLITLLCYLASNNKSTSLRSGIVLAQGGEFSFAILTFAVSNRLLQDDYGQVVLAALWISIAMSPFMIRYNKKISTFLLPKDKHREESAVEDDIKQKASSLRQHIIIAGFGHVGQHIARLLTLEGIHFIGLELDDSLVRTAQLTGKQVTYGDASHPGILKAAGITYAKAIVVSFLDLRTAIKMLGIIRQLDKKIPILVRCKDESEIDLLKKAGATFVIAEVFEESLVLAQYLYKVLHISQSRITSILQNMRKKDYDLLRD